MQPFGRNGYLVRLVLAAWLAISAAPAAVRAQETTQESLYSIDEVKAAFLYHFGTYVDWPTQTTTSKAITIAVLGAPTVVAQLEDFLPGRTIQGRRVEVKPIADIRDLADAELLFIGANYNSRLADLIKAVGQQPVLIVTDALNGLAQGAMINFQIVNERLRFEISLPAAQNAGLGLSSRLLSAALRVETAAECWLPCGEGPGSPLVYSARQRALEPRLISRSG